MFLGVIFRGTRTGLGHSLVKYVTTDAIYEIFAANPCESSLRFKTSRSRFTQNFQGVYDSMIFATALPQENICSPRFSIKGHEAPTQTHSYIDTPGTLKSQ